MKLDLVEKFFLRTVIDLRHRIASDDGYDLIIASGLLRKLLVDGTPLVILANRRPKLKLKFPILDPDPAPRKGWVLRGYIQEKQGRLDAFLGSQVIYLNGDPYAALEVIDACANSFGGVHASDFLDTRLRRLIQTRFADTGFIIANGAAENPLLVGVWQVALGALVGMSPLFDCLAQHAPKSQPVLNWLSRKFLGVPLRNLPDQIRQGEEPRVS
jgi:hypothetical protein